jgi:hypothetical protein
MPCVTYTARRGLAVGHVVDTSYTWDISISDLQRPSGRDLKETQESISGAVETLFFGEVRIWSVTLAPIRIRDAGIHYEFLRSTADGQVFNFDPYGSAGHPVQSLNVVRADSGYTESVFIREGAGGLTDRVTLGFQVREV